MSGFEITLLLALLIVVIGGLFYTGKLGNFKFKKKDMELGMEAPGTQVPQSTSISPTNIQISLSEASIKKELEDHAKNLDARIEERNLKLIHDVKKSLSSVTPDSQTEIKTLQQELIEAEAKLAECQKALKDRKKALTKREKLLEKEKLRNLASESEDELTQIKRKLEEGDASSAEELFSEYLNRKKTREEPWAEVAFNLGLLAKDRIEYKTALNYLEEAILLAPDDTLYLNEAGVLANTLGQYDKAIAFSEKALEYDLNSLGIGHPDVARAWNNLGEVWRGKGDDDKAIVFYEKALASILKTFGPEHNHVATLWNNLGAV